MADDASVLAEIARLTSAIEHHKSTGYAPTPPPYATRGGRGRGRGRGRGGFARGGGAGAGGSTTHRNAIWVAPGLQTQSTSRASTPAVSAVVAELVASRTSGGTTPVREGMGNLAVDGGSSAGEGKGKEKELVPRPVQPVPVKPQAREVVIDGVVFVADARGNKLVRKPDADPSTVSSSTNAPPSPSLVSGTPKRTSHLGTTYIRTKTGNLVSLAFARKRKEQAEARKKREEEMVQKGERLEMLVGVIQGTQAARNAAAAAGGRGGRGRGRGRGGFAGAPRRTKPPKPKSDKPCRFFQRTGQCSRAHTCPYVHDSSHISLCPLFLRPSGCPRPASQCPLSHTPNAHRSPHCVHFPSCTRPSCPYAHVAVSKDAGVCHDFAEFGWCPRGEECGMRHVRECWRFAETGRCEVKGCREPHVLRRKHESDEEDEEEDEEGEDEDGEVEAEERPALGGEADHAASGGAEKAAGLKRKRRESTDLSFSAGPAGISGAAGRRLTKKLKQAAMRRERGGGGDVSFGDGDDFVELMVPLSDDEEDEEGSEEEEDEEGEEEGMSVDSEDLDEEEDDVAEEEEQEEQQPPPDLLEQVHLVKKDPPPPPPAPRQRTSSTTVLQPDEDELDYGLSDDEDDAIAIEQMLRR